MVDYNKPFCHYHQETRENPRGTDCTAHLNEAHVFECPYTLIDLHYDRKRGHFFVRKPSHRHPLNPNGDCPAFVLGGLTPELTDKLRDVPAKDKLQTLLMLVLSETK